MTEEEKKAIEDLKDILKYWQTIVEIEDDVEREIEMNCYSEEMPFEQLKIALNIIEKQAEEIKNWKDTCHSLADEEQLKNQIKLFAPSIKALNKLEDGKKEAQFMSKLIKYYKVILKEKKQIYEELKRRNK